MPVFRSGSGLAPAWCELERFDIVELLPGESYAFERVGQKQKLIVGKGRCRIAVNGVSVTADEGANFDMETTDGRFEVLDVFSDATLIWMDGRWGEETGGSGIFTVPSEHSRLDAGDPVDYPKETTFDNHYHDCVASRPQRANGMRSVPVIVAQPARGITTTFREFSNL